MLNEDEKRRIKAEEDYRAEIRAKQKPIKTEGFTDRYNRIGVKIGLGLWLGFCLLL